MRGDWVELTKSDADDDIHVNMSNALTMLWIVDPGYTLIQLSGGKELSIVQTPEQIMNLLGSKDA